MAALNRLDHLGKTIERGQFENAVPNVGRHVGMLM
jgi:hypothetical protein